MITIIETIVIGAVAGMLLGAILGRWIQRRRPESKNKGMIASVVLLGALLGASAGFVVGMQQGPGLGAIGDLPAITTQHQLDEFATGEAPALLLLYTTNCPYCHHAAPIFRQVADEYGDRATFATLQVDAGDLDINLVDLIATPGGTPVPQIWLFTEGVPASDRVAGYEAMDIDQIRQMLDNALAEGHTGE
jgi:thiol-disulfide isomerase/thioredoxin